VRTGQPHRERPVGHVDLLCQGEVEHLGEEPGHTVDVRPVEQDMVEAGGAHAAGLRRPDVRVRDRRRVLRLLDLRKELDAVPGRHDEADSAAHPGLLAGGDLRHLDALRLDALLEGIEIAVAGDLEADHIHARRVGFAKNHAMPIELIPALEIDTSVLLATDLVEADAVDIVGYRRVQVEDAYLDVAWAQYSR